MRVESFEQAKLGGQEFGLRYLSDFPRLEPFYAADYRSAQSLAAHAQKLFGRTWKSRFERDLTADLLHAYADSRGASPATLANIEKLRRANCVCVVTGQQAGFGGGPLFTLFKALTALRVARELEQALASPVIPVFWIASDDSDVEEANRFRFVAERLEKFRFNIPAGKTPVRDINLPPADDPQWEKLRALMPQGPGREAALTWLGKFAGVDFGAAFYALMNSLIGGRGMVFIEPKALTSHPAWRRVLAQEIDKREEHRNLLRRAFDRLEAHGLNPGVPVTNQLNLFRHVKGERRRISDSGQKLLVDGSDSPLTKSSLLSALKADPAGFSPSVLLRPVIQNAIFPTVAYVGGLAEIAYHGLLKGLHAANQVFMPALMPRASLTIAQEEDLEQFRELLDFRGKLQWRQREAGIVFDGAEKGLRGAFAGLRQELGALARPLNTEIARLEAKTIHSMADARRRVQHDPLSISRESGNVARLLDRYFPEGEPQEREISTLAQFAIMGEELCAIVDALPNIFDFRHHVVAK